MGGQAYIKFRTAWRPATEMKIYGSATAPNGKKFRISQLAGKQVMGPGIPANEVQYKKRIVLNIVDPPMVEITMGIDKVVREGGGFMVKQSSKANPEVAVVTEIPVTPSKEDGQVPGDSWPPRMTDALLLETPLQKTVSLQALHAMAGALLTPASGGKKTTEPRSSEQADPKRHKPTPGGPATSSGHRNPPRHIPDFEKNQLSNLRPDLPHSWLFPAHS